MADKNKIATVVIEYKGIKCPNPNCGAVDNYTSGQLKKEKDTLTRPKTCKICGTIFKTMEVPIGIVEIKNNHQTASPQ